MIKLLFPRNDLPTIFSLPERLLTHYGVDHLPLQDGFVELLLELAHFGCIFLFLQEGYHEIEHVRRIFIDYLDHHSTQDRVDMTVQVLQILNIFRGSHRFNWLHEMLELEMFRERTM